VSLEAAILLRTRNSAMVELLRIENVMGLKLSTEVVDLN